MFADLCSSTAVALWAIALAISYFYVKYLYSYWPRRGVPYFKPTFPFGNFGKILKQKLSLSEIIDELYRRTTVPFIGVYGAFRPMLMIRDPDLIRTILIKDFQYFVDRGFYHDEKADPLSAHLFSIEGDKWRNLRAELTPAFTMGKHKSSFFSNFVFVSIYLNFSIKFR